MHTAWNTPCNMTAASDGHGHIVSSTRVRRKGCCKVLKGRAVVDMVWLNNKTKLTGCQDLRQANSFRNRYVLHHADRG